jgi:transcriptional regulator with XRE-family HTH domain
VAIYLDFGQLLRKCLENRGITQAEFAQKVGIPAGYPNNIMANRRTPSPKKLEKMADVLDLAGEDRLDFMVLGGLAHVPKVGGLRDYLTQTFQRLRAIEKRLKG